MPMRFPLFAVASFALVLALSPHARAAEANTPPTGFTALFNGKDLAGWHGLGHFDPMKLWAMAPAERKKKLEADNADMAKHWRVEDGQIISDGHGVFLTTDKDYGDFELTLDWKMMQANGDSGIYLRGTPQVQIWDPSNPREVGNGAPKGSGGLWNNSGEGKFPLVKADNPVGEWNTFHITMVGRRVTVYFNDKLVVNDAPLDNYFDHSQPVYGVGPIQLQTHGSEMHFRNVFLREIPRKPPESGVLFKGKPVGDGWVPLFEGDELKGFKAEPDYWTLKDGVLSGRYDGGPKHHYAYTEAEYGDFELHAMVKMTGKGANSGVCIRTKPTDFDNCPGYQVDMGPGFWGCLWDERRDGMVAKYPTDLADKLVKAGDWNHYYVIARGPYIQGWLNGVKTFDVINPRGIEKGSIGFQLCHGGKQTYADFKDVYIRPLGPLVIPPTLANDVKQGFVSLFNGEDLTGWIGATDNYMVEHGNIKCKPGKGGNLFLKDEYGDFDFRFEFRLPPGGNNGVGVRAPISGDVAYTSMELQILDNTAPQYNGLHPYQYHGSVYGVVPAKRGAQAPVGYWNYEEIIAKGEHITVIVNGVTITDVDLSKIEKTADGHEHKGLHRPSGYLGWAGHSDPVEFRNIRIKELK
jgi:3-keto-disaccharide hydrolase